MSADIATARLGGNEGKLGPNPAQIYTRPANREEKDNRGSTLWIEVDVKEKIHPATRKAVVDEGGDVVTVPATLMGLKMNELYK